MKNKKVKAIALLLATAMCITACGQTTSEPSDAENASAQEEENAQAAESTQTEENAPAEESAQTELDPVTIRVGMYSNPTPDDEKVEEYINNLPEVKEMNITVEFVKQPGGWGDYWEKLPLLLAEDEVDIVAEWGTSYISRVNSNAFADISEYLAKDEEFYNIIPEAMWDALRTPDGGIYAVPTYKELGEQFCLYVEQEFLDEIGVDPASIVRLEDAEVILEALKEAGRAPFMINGGEWSFLVQMNSLYNYDNFDDGLTMIDREEGKTVLSYYFTDEFEEMVKTMHDWNEKGYIHPDALTGVDFQTYYKDGAGKFGLGYVGYAPGNEDGYKSTFGLNVVPITITGLPVISNTSCRGTVFAVGANSKNPERAYQFLKLWNSVPEVKNAIAFGIPDVHYKFVGETQIERVPDAGSLWAGLDNWMGGNNMISYTTVDEDVDKYKKFQAWSNEGRNATNLGFFEDMTPIQDKISACNVVLQEYIPPLILGFVDDPESSLKELRDMLTAAGIEDIIAEVQTQYDAFLSAK